MPSVLFFSPFAGIPEHSLPERAIQQTFKAAGWRIHQIRCEGYLSSFCATMAASGLTPESSAKARKTVCIACQASSQSLRFTGDGFRTAEQFLTPKDYSDSSDLRALLEPDSWLETEFDGLPLARYASYEFLVSRKLHDAHIPKQLWREFREYVVNAALTSRVASACLSQIQPDRVVAYNTMYGVNRVWQHIAESRGIPCYCIHGGQNVAKLHNTLIAYRNDNEQLLLPQQASVADVLQHPISSEAVVSVGNNLMEQLKAQSVWIYSRKHQGLHPSRVRSQLGIGPKQKVLLAPLASADERYAASVVGLDALSQNPRVFADQSAWIRHLYDYANLHPDITVVVRVHPRMYPNKREVQTAAGIGALLDLLAARPGNVVVNIPSDGVSLTDLLQITTAGAVGTSTVGLQMLSYGLPVVIHDPHLLFGYPALLGVPVTERSAYTAALDLAIRGGWNLELSLGAFRWLNYLDHGVSRPVRWRDGPLERDARCTDDGKARLMKFARSNKSLIAAPARLAIHNFVTRSTQAASFVHVDSPQEPLLDLERVVRQLLPGLEALYVPDQFASGAEESNQHRTVLSQLGGFLGVFQDEPQALGARLAALATPGDALHG